MNESRLDRALALGFGASSGHSVLDAIERITGEVPRILLREPASGRDRSPIIDPSSSEKRSIPQGRGSYQILGEIARGGMGVVMKGHDTDLGRDVALKVLHKELAKRPEVLQRFVEEAQIGGQLQHPGIVPVYELGLMADERPYFTMKLVKGRTLGVLLAERKSSAADRRGLLDVFESVCQTMAYAHSRGVMHRDLKPANVMVGAFGEVQVVDWGLAKVLRTGGTADEKRAKQSNISIIETVRSDPGSHGSHSLVGSVMGTPAYMSPEQARGEIEKLDERSDVFSLGAILCEILTGAPAYRGESDKTLVEAAGAKLDDATRRLEGCDADHELVALCRECLAPAQDARPRSAEVLARRIHEYSIWIEERARQAQVDGAEARVKAQEERRARKLALALAASVLVTLGLGGAGWAWSRHQRDARLRHTTDQVDAALADAGRARGAKDWGVAQAAIARARASLEMGQESDELRSLVSGTANAIEADASSARASLARRARNSAFLERLDRIRSLERGVLALAAVNEDPDSRTPLIVTGTNTLEQREAAYLGAFEAFGIDADSQPEATVAELLRSSGIASELALAFDDWAGVRTDIDTEFRERSRRLVRIAMDADSDPWRRDLRAAILSEDPSRLLALASSAKDRALEPVTAMVLARALVHLHQAEQSLPVLLKSASEHPADFPLLLQLGRQLLDAKPRRVDEALRYLTAARALRPESAAALDRLSVGTYYAKDIDRAIWMAHESLRLDPDNARVRGNLGLYLYEKGDLDGALESCRKAIEIEPTFALWQNNLGLFLHDNGEEDAAIASYGRAIELDPSLALARNNLGSALLKKGDLDGAIASHRKAVELEPTSAFFRFNLAIALSRRGSALTPNQDDLDEAIECYRRVIEIDAGYSRAHGNLGFLLSKRGEQDASIASIRAAIELDPTYALWHNNLGSELLAKGELDAAVASYRKATELDPRLAMAHNGLGNALYSQRDRQGAIEAYRKAIELDPTRGESQHNLGVVLRETGDFDGAIAAYRRGIELDPDIASDYGDLGAALYDKGDLDAAVDAELRAIALDPRYAAAYDILGNTLQRTGDLEGAIKAQRQAIELDPRVAGFHVNLGRALGETGDFDGAIRSYREALEIDPGFTFAYKNLGLALDAQGDPAHAIECFRKALELEPKDALASNALAWLLATCADRDRRDGAEAVRLARRAVELLPDARCFNTLGAALCCAGEWQEAIEVLDCSMRLASTQGEIDSYLSAVNCCFLAMAHAHSSAHDEASRDLTRAKSWHDAHPQHANAAEMARFLDEAREAIETAAKR